MMSSISISGCLIGVKQKNTIVYSGFAKTPIEAKGAIRVATNDKIRVTVVGKSDFETEMDLGGMYVIRGSDLKALINAAKAKP